MSEFLVDRLGVEDVGAVFPSRVSLHTTCHSRRGIDVGDAPLRLLRAVEGLEVVELPNTLECCGFGGTFAVKNPDTSLAMLSDKIRDIRDSGAEVVTAVDNSCLMHIAGGLRRQGLLRENGGTGPDHDRRTGKVGRPIGSGLFPAAGDGVRVLHLAEILASREGDSP
jgi:Fe-S oxidoreductase